MARTSRRSTPIPETAIQRTVPQVKNRLAAAAYVRLSVEDKEETSLETQALMVRQYIEDRPDLYLGKVYLDNGHTGTNFNRPAFMSMMDDARRGQIQCIVVKDLSRFGRNYLETGYFIETLLPKLGVRLIAVNDNYDSSREEDRNNIAIPIKNMVNAMYAKDISRKLCSSNEARRRRPDVVPNGTEPYGYHLNEQKNRYLIEEEIAPYVRMLFRWLVIGKSNFEVAEYLNLVKAPTPGVWRFADTPRGKTFMDIWRSSTVNQILHHPIYVGDVALGRFRAAAYKGQPYHETKAEEWIVRENEHEPYLPREDQEKILRLVNQRISRTQERLDSLQIYRDRYQDAFPQKVYCADCGARMHFYRFQHNYLKGERVGAYYVCPKEIGKFVYEDFLRIIVNDQIHLLIRQLCDVRSLLEKQKDSETVSVLRAVEKKLSSLRRQLTQIEGKLMTLYEDYTEKLLDAEEYRQFKTEALSRAETLRAQIQETEEKKRQQDQLLKTYYGTVQKLEKHLEIGEFEPALADELVESIHVSQDGRIEIKFKMEDLFEQARKMTEETEDKDL